MARVIVQHQRYLCGDLGSNSYSDTVLCWEQDGSTDFTPIIPTEA